MRNLILLVFFIGLATSASGAPELAVSMVPRSKVVELLGRDVVVKTSHGTKVTIEFTRDGKLEEAYGKNLNKGDDLEPGDGLISLSTAAQSLMKNGIKPEGYWLLEKDQQMGWIYEVSGNIVNAKTGEIIQRLSETITSNQ